MDSWKKIKISGIAAIEQCVAEFNIWETEKTPYGKFKIKIFEKQDGSFIGISNIRIRNAYDGSPESAVGFGQTITEALNDTLEYFLKMLGDREDLAEEQFEWSDGTDF